MPAELEELTIILETLMRIVYLNAFPPEWNIELGHGIKALESPEHLIVSVTPDDPGMILPTWSSMYQADMVLMTVTAMDTRRNEENKTK